MPELPSRANIIVDAARKTTLLAHEGTATAGASGTLTDTNRLIHPANNDLQGYELYIHTGTASGDSRRVSASTSAAQLLTVAPNFSATPNTSSQYLLFVPSGRFIATLLLDGIDAAIRRLRGRKFTQKTVEEYVIQDLLWGYGGMQRWTSGASAAPDGWTLDAESSIARSTSVPNRMAYSAAITTDGSNIGSLSRSVAAFADYNELSVSLYGWVFSNTASRVTLRITDGVTTNNSDALTAANTWTRIGPGQDLELNALILDNKPTELTASVQVSAGGAVVATCNDLQLLLSGRTLSLLEMPTGNGYGPELTSFQYVHSVEHEDVRGSFNFPHRIPNEHVRKVQRNAETYMSIDGYDLAGLAGRRLRMLGQISPTILTSNTSTTSIDSDYLSAYAAWYALRGLPSRSGLKEDALQRTEVEWRELDRQFRETPKGDSILFERN
jgi:hypothetical protein